MQWSATGLCGGLSVYNLPLPQKQLPLATQLKSPLGDSCYNSNFMFLKIPK